MRKSFRILVVGLVVCALMAAAAGCSGKADVSASPSPTETVAAMIVVTPAPTPVATPTPSEEPSQATESASSSSDASSGSGNVLKLKMEGDAVTEAQERLQALGYLNKVTGYFGTETEAAVKSFQQKNNLDADGMIGPMTMEVLMSDSAVEA